MARPRGLSTSPWARLPVMRWVTVLAATVIGGAYLTTLLVRPLGEPLLIHSFALLLIALAAYSWAVLSVAGGAVMSALVLVGVLGAFAITRLTVLGVDALALVALIGMASAEQHHRQFGLHRLTQRVEDLDDAWSVKGQALQNAQQGHAALQRKLTRYQQLHTIAEHLSRVVELEGIARLTVDRAFDLIGKSDVSLLFLVDQERQELALHASKKAPQVAVIRAKQGDQFDHYVLRTQRPLLVNDVRRDFRFSVTGEMDRPLGSVIACPVLIGENAEGVLRLDSPQTERYTQDDLRILDILLDLVETAMANARLFAQTQQLAITDGLTDLYRRQPFLEQLAREVARATRSREPLAVLMLDLDDFKRYNDTFGHLAGDLVLKTVANIVRSSVPPDGMCARYGGEEFAILLPRSSQAHGAKIAGRIRQTVETYGRTVGNGSGHPMTVSLGVAIFPDDAQSDLELIRRSDQRLYEAKRQGKNRVCSS